MYGFVSFCFYTYKCYIFTYKLVNGGEWQYIHNHYVTMVVHVIIIINYLLHILIIITTRYIVYYILCALVITEEKAHMNCVSNHIILLGRRSHELFIFCFYVLPFLLSCHILFPPHLCLPARPGHLMMKSV